MLFMVPLVILFLQIVPAQPLALGWIAALFGTAGMLLSAFGQGLLVLGRIDFQESLKFFPAGGAIGVRLILVCALAAYGGQMPQLLAWTGILAGAGFILTIIGFLQSGQQNVLFYIGALALGISYPIWAIWLGRLLFSGMVEVGAG
jgi:hypothetical protein